MDKSRCHLDPRNALVSVNGCESMVTSIEHIQNYVVRALWQLLKQIREMV